MLLQYTTSSFKMLLSILLVMLSHHMYSVEHVINIDSIEKKIQGYPEHMQDSLYYEAGKYAYSFNSRSGYYQALQYYLKTLDIAIKYDNQYYVEKAYFGIGSVHDANNNGDHAVHYYKLYHNAILNRYPDDYTKRARSYYNIAVAYVKKEDSDSCRMYADSIISALKYITDEEMVAKNKLLVSNLMYTIGDTAAFIRYFESIPEHTILTDGELSYGWQFCEAKSHYYIIKGEKKKGLKSLISGLAYTRDSITALRIIINTAALIEDYKSAHYYQAMMNDLDKRVINRDMYEDINFRLLHADILLKQKDNEILFSNNEKVEQRLRIMYFFLLFIIILAVFSYFFLKKIQIQNRRLKWQNNEIKKQNEINKLMFKELHHRVKNNLQIIVSLIELQIIKNNEEMPSLNEMKIKIHSMEIAHQMMYTSKDLENINLSDYFTQLIQANINTFGIKQELVKLNIQLGNFRLSLDHLIPFAISISEMMTNTVKYVISRSNSVCEISLISGIENDSVVITYRDSGDRQSIADRDPDREGMGTRLIRRLAQQINARLVMNRPEIDGYYQYKYYFRKEMLL